jgi:hypothetical protein
MRRVTVITCCGLVLGLAATPAFGAGGPVPPMQGGAGVSAPGGDVSFIAVQAGDRTVVMRVRRADATVVHARSIAGSFGVPGVTYDGINTGISADQGTLVLAAGMRRFPIRSTALRVLDGRTLRLRGRIVLPGMVSVDAISPDGRWLYLVDYKDGAATQYDVRAYDLERGRMLSKPIVDAREPDEKLQGTPITRVQSTDGRWAYTLYTGEKSFIHALDTVGRTAVCIDVPQVTGADVGDIRLTLDDGGLRVEQRGAPVALVDLRSFKVSAPKPVAVAAATATAAPPKRAAGADGPAWALWMLPLAAFAVLVGLAGRRRARLRR